VEIAVPPPDAVAGPSGPRRRRRLIVAAIVAVALVAAAGVAVGVGGRSGGGTHGAVIAGASGLDPGSDLGAGLTVVEGSRLVAPPIPAGQPTADPTVVDDGFTAILEVDGDPLTVMQAYIAQTGGTSPGIGCEDADGVQSCAATVYIDGGANPAALELSSWRGLPDGARPVSHLELVYTSFPVSDAAREVAERVRPPARTPLSVPDVTSPPRPDGVAPSGGEQTMFVGADPVAPLPVLAGSRLLADVVPRSGWPPHAIAVLEVTGDPATVHAAYRELLGDTGSDGASERPPRDVAAGRIMEFSGGETGGVDYQARLFVRDDGDAWLLIEAGYD